MRKRKLFQSIILTLTVSFTVSCLSENERCFEALIKRLNINQFSSYSTVVFVPSTGCELCISDAINDIKESKDTLYVVLCSGSKEYRLLTGLDYRKDDNIYIDSLHTSIALGLVETVPLVYNFNKGNFLSVSGFHSKDITSLVQTQIHIDKEQIHFGNIQKNDTISTSFVISNQGTNELVINNIEKSCDCVTSEISDSIIKSGDFALLRVSVSIQEEGYFQRELMIYGNFNNSPLTLSVDGFVKTN